MTVHFQRVECFITAPIDVEVAAEDTALGLDVESAQLIAHPLDGGFHLDQGDLRVADLLLDTAPEYRGFPRQIGQVLQLLGRNLDHLRTGTLDFGLRLYGRWINGGRGDLSRRILRCVDSVSGGSGRGVVTDALDQQRRVGQRLVTPNGIHHVGEHVVAALQQAVEQRAVFQRTRR